MFALDPLRSCLACLHAFRFMLCNLPIPMLLTKSASAVRVENAFFKGKKEQTQKAQQRLMSLCSEMFLNGFLYVFWQTFFPPFMSFVLFCSLPPQGPHHRDPVNTARLSENHFRGTPKSHHAA